MADEDRNDAKSQEDAPETELERTRKLILERRNRFMAAALAGLGMASGSACTRATRSTVCLSFAAGGGGASEVGGSSGRTAINGPCPNQPWKLQPPCVCLSAPLAGGPGPGAGTIAPPVGGTVATPTAGRAANGGSGGTTGRAGPRPGVCLSAPIDEDAGTERQP